ncbi:MAG: Lrp/AsnC family transcriptional regulator [Desulfobacterales bacterium]
MNAKASTNHKTRTKPLDRIDRRIIALLQQDGRIANTEIAKQVGVSEATVRTRVNRLIQEEFVQIVAVSNPIKLGFGIVGTLRIKVDISKMEHVTRELEKLKPLWFIVNTTGGADIVTEFIAKSLDDLNELIFNQINKINGIQGTETNIFLKYVKRRYDWGTALDD